MKYEELIIFLSCHGMEDFPLYYTGDEAEGLLACYTALWHPALLASAGRLPVMQRPEDPPEELSGRLMVVPPISDSEIPVGFAHRTEKSGGRMIRKSISRAEIVQQALDSLDEEHQLPSELDALAADFLALGYCYQQVSALTHQLRYTDNLDQLHFEEEVVIAARAAIAGDEAKARDRLAHCFDILSEARDQSYPVDAFLIDLTLVAESTIGQSLRTQLQSPTPTNLLISGRVLERMASEQAETLSALREAIGRGQVELIGGEYDEGPLTLMSREEVLGNFRRGLAVYEKHLGCRPKVFGRRRFGLSPILPAILRGLGFQGVLHATLDDGHLPQPIQCRALWEGSDGTEIEALMRVPLDARRAETMLGLAEKLSESMDNDQVATVCMAHWPAQTCDWFEDLQRVNAYGPVLGKLVTLSQLFDETESHGEVAIHGMDQYRSPYLEQDVAAGEENPLSAHADRHRQDADRQTRAALETMAALLGGESSQEDADSAAAVLAEQLPRGSEPARSGYLIANAWAFPRRVGFDATELTELPKVDSPVFAAQADEVTKQVVVDVPALGYAWVGSGESPPPPLRGKAAKPMAEENMLRNEFMEATIDPTTGAIRSVGDYVSRGARISQQLALRQPGPRPNAGDIWQDPDEMAIYSVMAADSIEITSAGPALGQIISRGRLLSLAGETLAEFSQTMSLWKGSRVLVLDIQLDAKTEPLPDPWNSYYAVRFAWNDAAADMWRAVAQSAEPTDAKRLEAPHYLELRGESTRTAILTGGLPYHKRTGMRIIDSLLAVRGERSQKFRLGIGIDLKYPLSSALELLSPPTTVAQSAAPPCPSPASWLLHLSARNVMATHWEPLVEEDELRGVKVRLLETEGRPAKCRLSAFRPFGMARQVDFCGEEIAALPIVDRAVEVELKRGGWIEVEARWPS
jgi:alpha-mannosidase